MVQYIPENWPYDQAHPSEQEDRIGGDKAALYLIVFEQPDVARYAGGCFKARQMVDFWQRRMHAYA